jgi:hypothetical protein
VILAAAALRVAFTADPDRPWRGAARLVAVSLLVTTPSYPWYVLLLVMLIAYGAPAEWLILAPAAYLAQFAHDLTLSPLLAQRLGYGAALAVIVTGLVIRARARRLGRSSGRPESGTVAGADPGHGAGDFMAVTTRPCAVDVSGIRGWRSRIGSPRPTRCAGCRAPECLRHP